jgi:hypothetical protein
LTKTIIVGAERFQLDSVTTTGTIQCATNQGAPFQDVLLGGTAIVKGGSFSIQATMTIPGPFINGEVSILNASYGDSGINVTMPIQNISTQQSISYTFNIEIGPTPNYVYGGPLVIKLKTMEDSGDSRIEGLATIHFQLYTVYAAPKAPQDIPWVGVLQDACTYASRQRTEETVAKECTLGVFFGGNFGVSSRRRFYYPGNMASHWIDQITGNFNLTSYLTYGNQWYTTWLPGNCSDVSTYLSICTNSLGLSFTPKAYTDSVLGQITTNPICAIGSLPASLMNYEPWTWAFHQIAMSSDNLVYDACAAQWSGPNGLYQNPPAGWLLTAPSSDPALFNYWSSLPVGLVYSPTISAPTIHHPVLFGVQ